MEYAGFRDEFIIKVKINLLTPDNLKKYVDGKEFVESDAFIVLREMTSSEFEELQTEKGSGTVVRKLLPKAIVEHNITENDVLIKNEKVSAMIIDSFTQYNYVTEKWISAMPLKKSNPENSGTPV